MQLVTVTQTGRHWTPDKQPFCHCLGDRLPSLATYSRTVCTFALAACMHSFPRASKSATASKSKSHPTPDCSWSACVTTAILAPRQQKPICPWSLTQERQRSSAHRRIPTPFRSAHFPAATCTSYATKHLPSSTTRSRLNVAPFSTAGPWRVRRPQGETAAASTSDMNKSRASQAAT